MKRRSFLATIASLAAWPFARREVVAEPVFVPVTRCTGFATTSTDMRTGEITIVNFVLDEETYVPARGVLMQRLDAIMFRMRSPW